MALNADMMEWKALTFGALVLLTGRKAYSQSYGKQQGWSGRWGFDQESLT